MRGRGEDGGLARQIALGPPSASASGIGLGSGMSEASSHPLQQVAVVGPWGGPSYSYRGARIQCAPGGHVCGLTMRDHPLNGTTFGVVGTITPLVDVWLDEGRLPRHIRQRPKL